MAVNVAKNNDLSEAADSSAFMSAIGYFYKLTVWIELFVDKLIIWFPMNIPCGF